MNYFKVKRFTGSKGPFGINLYTWWKIVLIVSITLSVMLLGGAIACYAIAILYGNSWFGIPILPIMWMCVYFGEQAENYYRRITGPPIR